ncbi:hypothetical protein PULV_a3980 [Pseudoalteromonas ulvae UL12]|uniref:DUF5916 domain-containing protein n=1 Tax=Pseudoalteromonas ulvae TaxID=107327 RepID=UPI00186BABD1|nr:DUF5916 domain-containing protein [Pseudoalteromonas ulvae]MBE0362173.1 hypothetical protein [Pseudoalteromonas ulvae UL12]
MKYAFNLIKLILFWGCMLPFYLCAEMKVDGALTEAEWQQAKSYAHFVMTDPDTGVPATYSTEAKLLIKEEGLYVAFINKQPPESRIKIYSPRDKSSRADFNRLVVDFEGDGKTAYEFTVTLGKGYGEGIYINGNEFSSEWNGAWSFAVSEDDENWYSEIFLPWSIALYTAPNKEKVQEIGISFGRIYAQDAVEFSYPFTHWSRNNFIGELDKVAYNIEKDEGLLTLIPQFTSNYNTITDDLKSTVGVDIMYKPNSNQLVMATINPDYGAVDSDDLVSNFSPIENLFQENRQFFTENHSLFDVKDDDEAFMLVYTRRIGVTKDNGKGGLAFATKYINVGDTLDTGFMAAIDKDVKTVEGPQFFVGRANFHTELGTIGYLTTYVDAQEFDRQANVHGIDFVNSSDNWLTKGNLLYSHINMADQSINGYGGFVDFSYFADRDFNINAQFMWLDDKLELDDLGYLERGNLKQFELSLDYSFYDFSPNVREVYSDFELTLSENFDGLSLAPEYGMSMLFFMEDASQYEIAYEEKLKGIDDLISFGFDPVEIPSQKDVFLLYQQLFDDGDKWIVSWNIYQEGLKGWANALESTFLLSWIDKVSLTTSFFYLSSNDWLIGDGDGGLERYEREFLEMDVSLLYLLKERHEMTLRIQWNGIKANALDRFTIQDRQMLVSDDLLEDFSESDLSLQLKYKYQIDPLSSLTLAYTRQGSMTAYNDELVGFDKQFDKSLSDKHTDVVTLKWVMAY